MARGAWRVARGAWLRFVRARGVTGIGMGRIISHVPSFCQIIFLDVLWRQMEGGCFGIGRYDSAFPPAAKVWGRGIGQE